MSERVTRRYDDTIDKKRVNHCVLKHLFRRELNNQKNQGLNQFIHEFGAEGSETLFSSLDSDFASEMCVHMRKGCTEIEHSIYVT